MFCRIRDKMHVGLGYFLSLIHSLHMVCDLDIAGPLLRKYDIPAIVFVAVDALERGIMWNDIIIEAA